MAAPPGYHGWGPPPPHLAPAPYPTRPPYRPPPYAPPPGYAYPTGPPGPGYRYAPPPEAPYREPPRAAPPGGSYAEEKPAAYQAFKQQAVRLSSAGAEVGLSNGMCQDRHVKDFLLCFQCWLWRTYGDPERHGSWRLQRLDLSRNTLSDESLCSVLETLKALDLRVGRLLLSGNRLRGTGLAKVTDYIWNCRDPLVELDLSDNEIHGEVGESDGISGLLRCLYNHPSYPMMQEHQKAVPLQLGLGGNYIKDAQGLMNDILAKGSKDGKAPKIRICSSPESYLQDHEEFLSLFLAGNFLQQRGGPPGNHAPDASAITVRSRSRRRQKRKAQQAQQAQQVAQAQPQPAPVAVPEAPPPAAPAAEHGHRRRRKEKTEAKEAPQAPQAPAQVPLLSEEDHKKLQAEVGKKLQKLEGLPSDQSTCDMLSEFTVCMFVARKAPQEVETELASFLGQDYATKLAAWFMKHVRHHYKPAAVAAGWK